MLPGESGAAVTVSTFGNGRRRGLQPGLDPDLEQGGNTSVVVRRDPSPADRRIGADDESRVIGRSSWIGETDGSAGSVPAG
jgi:hypothetical protein